MSNCTFQFYIVAVMVLPFLKFILPPSVLDSLLYLLFLLNLTKRAIINKISHESESRATSPL